MDVIKEMPKATSGGIKIKVSTPESGNVNCKNSMLITLSVPGLIQRSEGIQMSSGFNLSVQGMSEFRQPFLKRLP